MKKLGLFLLGAVIFFATILQASQDVELEALPRGRPFRLTFGDPREIKMALGFQADGHINAAIGNYFSLLGLRSIEGDWAAHFGIEGAGYFQMRQAQSRFPLETADGLIGLYLEGKRKNWAIQFRYTHVSAHLADGSTAQPIAYSRETAIARIAFSFDPLAEVYAGASLLTNSIPKAPGTGAQWGGFYFLPVRGLGVIPFAAADFKWRAETKYDPSMNLELGIALNQSLESYRSFRIYYNYYTGEDPRGQYFNQPFTAHMIGIEMQI